MYRDYRSQNKHPQQSRQYFSNRRGSMNQSSSLRLIKSQRGVFVKIKPQITQNQHQIEILTARKISQFSSPSQFIQRTKRPSSAYRNTNIKLSKIQLTFPIILNQIVQLRRQTQNTLSIKKAIQPVIIDQLQKIRENHKKQICGLTKKIKIKKQISYKRSRQIWEDISKIWDSNQNLKEMIFQLKMKVQKLEDSMGGQAYIN